MRFRLRPAHYPLLAVAASAMTLATLTPASAAQATTKKPAATETQVTKAAARPDATFSCGGTDFASSRYCYVYTYSGTTPVFNPQNALSTELSGVTEVKLTCYYDGSQSGWKSDGILDHVTWISGYGNVTGHIPDPYINLGGLYPSSSPFDLPYCG